MNRISSIEGVGFGKGRAMQQASDADHPLEPVRHDVGKRSAHRRRTLKEAKAILTDWTTIDCTIRDMSEGGARLVFGDAFSLPDEFRLLTVSANTIVPVKLLWQRGLTAGVAFTGPEAPAPAHKV